MNSIDLIILNFNEVRRRSLKVWKSIPEEVYNWRPDNNAMSCLEMVRHVLEAEHYYHLAIKNLGSVPNFESPFANRPLISPEDEIDFALPMRDNFIETVRSFNEDDLSNIKIDRSNVGYIKELGDILLRIAYHESIHTGQLLDYLRSAGVERADIWD